MADRNRDIWAKRRELMRIGRWEASLLLTLVLLVPVGVILLPTGLMAGVLKGTITSRAMAAVMFFLVLWVAIHLWALLVKRQRG